MGLVSLARAPSSPDPLRACRLVAEGSPSSMLLTQGPAHVVRYSNPSFAALCAQPADALLGCPFASVVPGPDAAGWVALLDDVYRTGQARSSHAGHGDSPLSSRHVSAWPALADGTGEGGGGRHLVVEVGLDAAEASLRLAEETRQVNERLVVAGVRMQELVEEAEAAVRAREEVLAAVSHDLMNPLASILFSAALLARGADAEAVRPHAERIQRTAQLVQRLIRDLVEAAKIDARHLVLVPERVELAPLVREVAEMMSPLAAASSLRIETVLGDEVVSAAIVADRARLVQVLSNLLGNAIKFSLAGGTIVLSASRSATEVTLVVRDNGTGIGPDEIPHLFERFWQARPEAQLGAGLGLFIAKSLVEAHGGRIWVESRVGAGSAFFVAIPLAPPP